MELVNPTEGTDTNIDFANIRRVFKYPIYHITYILYMIYHIYNISYIIYEISNTV